MSFKKSIFIFVIINLFLTIQVSLTVNCTTIDRSKDTSLKASEDPRIKRNIFETEDTDNYSREDPNSALRVERDAQSATLFSDNLLAMSHANMSDCMARLHCEERCNATSIDGENSEETSEEDESELPQYIKYFLDAGKLGAELGKKGHDECRKCQEPYSQCNEMQYDYTVKTEQLYEDLVKKNLIKFDINDTHGHGSDLPQNLEFLHHSMEFLDISNLTQCYARVACESTCATYKEHPQLHAPPQTSPVLVDDPYKPKSVDIIHNGALNGYTLAKNGDNCESCSGHYLTCDSDKYSIAKSSSIIFG